MDEIAACCPRITGRIVWVSSALCAVSQFANANIDRHGRKMRVAKMVRFSNADAGFADIFVVLFTARVYRYISYENEGRFGCAGTKFPSLAYDGLIRHRFKRFSEERTPDVIEWRPGGRDGICAGLDS
jgi:hypothetical protein